MRKWNLWAFFFDRVVPVVCGIGIAAAVALVALGAFYLIGLL